MTKRNCLLLLLFSLLWVTAAWAAGQRLTVQTQDAELRKSASYTSGVVSKLSYGETVSVLEEKGSWYRVSSGSGTGWMHNSAFAGGRPAGMSAGGADASAKVSDREVSMAGKGFNPEVERAYRSTHPEGYAKLEAMMRLNYSPGQLEAFLAAGKVGQ